MLNYQVKIGLVPIRRDCSPRPGMFNWEYAEERGKKLVSYIESHFTKENVSFADLKGVIDVETLYAEDDIDKVVSHFCSEKVDAILIINANFGNEEAAAMLAKKMDVPALLWAPLDDVFEPDGLRHTDSQCGLFGTSRQFQRYNIPFTFIKNCRVEDEAFAKGLDRFTRVACMIKNFRGMRIGEVGMRPKPFCSVIFNEGELMQRFGLHIIPINMAVIADKFNRILLERDEEAAQTNNNEDSTSATVRKLQQFKGVGDRLSRHLPWEIGDFRRFGSGKQFAAFFGLTPCPYSSGTMRRDQGISKTGRKSLRKMAVECAWLWYRWQKDSWLVKKWADRLEQKGRIRRTAIVALARQLMVALWRYVVKDEAIEGAIINKAIAA